MLVGGVAVGRRTRSAQLTVVHCLCLEAIGSACEGVKVRVELRSENYMPPLEL